MAYSEALASRIRDVLNGPDVTERKMFGGLAFLMGGRMCCGVQDTDLMVRVPKDRYAQLLMEPHVRQMEFTGRPLKGFVYVSAAGTETAVALRRWLSLAERVAREATPAASKQRARAEPVSPPSRSCDNPEPGSRLTKARRSVP